MVPIFRLDGVVVTDAICADLSVRAVRARFGVDEAGRTILVEDLTQPGLDDALTAQEFAACLALRRHAAAPGRACARSGAPAWLEPIAPGASLGRVLDAARAQGGRAPPALVVTVGRAAITARLPTEQRAPDNAPALLRRSVWLGFDGSARGRPGVALPGEHDGDSILELTRARLLREPDAGSDVYAAGVAMHSLHFGAHPYVVDHAAPPARRVAAIAAGRRTVRAEPDDALGLIIEDCTNVDPHRRPVSLAALLEALSPFAVDDAEVARVLGGLLPVESASARGLVDELALIDRAHVPDVVTEELDLTAALAWWEHPLPGPIAAAQLAQRRVVPIALP